MIRMLRTNMQGFLRMLSIYFPGEKDKEILSKLVDEEDTVLQLFLDAVSRAVFLISAKKKNLPDGFLSKLLYMIKTDDCGYWCGVRPFDFCEGRFLHKYGCSHPCSDMQEVIYAWINTGWTYEEVCWIYPRGCYGGKGYHQGYRKTTEETGSYCEYTLELDIELRKDIVDIFKNTGAKRFQSISLNEEKGVLHLKSINPEKVYKKK